MKNTAPLQLQRISVFMPQRLRDDEVRQLFVMRQDVFQTLLDSIKAERGGSIPQHHLIIGQRGMGKTTLLKRLDVELRGTTLSQTYIPFTFPEEQYNIDRLSKFWLNSLDALADTLQSEGDEKTAFQLDEQIAALAVIRNEQELSQKAYETLREAAKTLGRRPVFLLDNLNLIFDRLGEVEQSKLRKVITEPGAPIFIGASPEAFDEDLQYDAPFYDAFAVHFLYKLDFPQTLTMLRHLAEITDQRTLLSQLTADNIPRLETLHMLTGGNVRTVVILFSLVAQGFSADVFQDLEALIDQMTPLYKSRFEELSPQAQVVVDAVALNWDPCKLETLRERTSLGNNQLSVQLDRLGKAGWVNKLGKRKAANYEISERFFNIWYLMRRATRRQRRDLLWLTRFLQAWFTRPELVQQAKQFMRDLYGKENEYELGYGLALARALPNQTGEKLKQEIYWRLINIVDGDLEKLKEFVGVNIDETGDLVNRYNNFRIKKLNTGGLIAEGKEKWEEAELKYRQAIEIDERNADSWYRLAKLQQRYMQKYDEAVKSYYKALSINPGNEWYWTDLGDILEAYFEDYEKSEAAYRKALKVNPKSFWAWSRLGDLLLKLDRNTEAREAYEKHINLVGDSPLILINLAKVYENLGLLNQVEDLYKRAIKGNPRIAFPKLAYAMFLQLRGRLTEADRMYKKAVSTKQRPAEAHLLYATLLQTSGRYTEAEKQFNLAFEIDKDEHSYWHRIGVLYQYQFKKYERASYAYRKALDAKPGDINTKSEMMLLIRDCVGNVRESKVIFDEIKQNLKHKYTRLLGEATYYAYDQRWDLAGIKWQEALLKVGNRIPVEGLADFYSSAAVTIRIGCGEELLSVFRNTQQDKISRPFYEAVKALTLNSEEYLKTEVAAEVREVALQIFKFMQDYNAPASQHE